MVKISKAKHVTKKGVVKKNPKSFSSRIKELIKIQNDLDRGDLQGMAEAIASSKSGSDWKLEMEISDRILIIVDNAHNFTAQQIKYHIEQLERDIKNLQLENQQF